VKIFLLLILIVAASLSGFLVHVTTMEWLPSWIGTQMRGIEIKPSWNVRYIAAITSVEYGIAAVSIYYLSREKLLTFGKFKCAVIFSILLMSIHAVLIRQPLMDFIVGNPLHVILVQNGFKCLVWALMSFIVVYGFEFIHGSKVLTNKSTSPLRDRTAQCNASR